MSTEYPNMADKITTTITYLASGGAVLLSFLNQNAAAVGILIGIFTFGLNWWFHIQKIKIEKAKLTDQEIKRL
jgi:hypothetical protein